MKDQKKEPIRLSTTITPEFEKNVRNNIHYLRMYANEVLEMYQASFFRELDREKEQKIKVSCDSCKVKNYPSYMWLVSKEKELYYCYPCKRK